MLAKLATGINFINVFHCIRVFKMMMLHKKLEDFKAKRCLRVYEKLASLLTFYSQICQQGADVYRRMG